VALIEGTTEVKSITAAYDFAVDGGAVGDIVLRGIDASGNSVPAGATVITGWVDVATAVTATGGTFALKLEGTADLLAGAASITTGRKSIIPVGTGATAIRTTATRSITATVATAAATTGKLTVTLIYV
jgi:hypothetical protein